MVLAVPSFFWGGSPLRRRLTRGNPKSVVRIEARWGLHRTIDRLFTTQLDFPPGLLIVFLYYGRMVHVQSQFDQNDMTIIVRIVLLAIICGVFYKSSEARLSSATNLGVIVAGVLLTYPVVWIGGKILGRHHTKENAVWTTTFVHFSLGFTFGVPIVRALVTHDEWRFWILPVPTDIGFALVVVTGAASFLVVATLALRGFGAPFFIVLSRKLAVDWLYAWTRNPMVLAGLAWFVSLGIWFQSMSFLLWVLILLTPALLYFLKVFEEKELELRFGPSYLEYKSRTPMLWPQRPRA